MVAARQLSHRDLQKLLIWLCEPVSVVSALGPLIHRNNRSWSSCYMKGYGCSPAFALCRALKRSVMLEYDVIAKRIDFHGSAAHCKEAEIVLDTDMSGRRDAFNPAELLLAAIAACMIKGIERVTPIIRFDLRGAEVRLHGVRQDSPPFMSSISYELTVDTDEDDHRLDLLHHNVRRYGTIFNTIAAATKLDGRIVRARRSTTLLSDKPGTLVSSASGDN